MAECRLMVFKLGCALEKTSGAMKAMDSWAALQEVLTRWSGVHPGLFISPQVVPLCSYSLFHSGWNSRGKEGCSLLNSFKHRHKEKKLNKHRLRLHFWLFSNKAFTSVTIFFLFFLLFLKIVLGNRKAAECSSSDSHIQILSQTLSPSRPAALANISGL